MLFFDEPKILIGQVPHLVDLIETGRGCQALPRFRVAFLVEVEYGRFWHNQDDVQGAQDAQREELDGYYAVVLRHKLELESEDDNHEGSPEQFEENNELLASGMDVVYNIQKVHDGSSSKGRASEEKENV